MNHLRLVVVACVAAALAGSGFAWAHANDASRIPPSVSADPSTAVRTDLPVTAASSEPDLVGLAVASPAAGDVTQVAGPFDDRFHLHGLSFDGTSVSGRLTVTKDVSDLLELQVLAGFYDRRGHLLGKGRYSFHLVEDGHTDVGPPDESRSFRIRVPDGYRARAVAAAVGVPVLVNE